MSQPAEKRVAEHEETTGVRRTETVLPPREGSVGRGSLEDMGAVLELAPDELVEVEAPAVATPRMVSGVVSRRPPVPTVPPPVPVVEDAELMALGDSLQPYYREQERKVAERARLDVEDLSLQPGNPYSASSLVPPPKQPFPVGKAMAITAGAVVVLVAGWIVLRGNAAQPVATKAPAVERPIAAAPAAAPAPVTPAAQVQAETPAEPVRTEVEAPIARPAVVAAPKAPVAKAPAAPAATTEVAPAEVAQVPAVPAPAAPAVVADPAITDPAAAIALPETPSREDVTAAFQSVREQLSVCAAGKHGVAKIDITVANSGRVSHALIDGAFKGTPEGSCMARAVRTARFPQFSQASLKVSYPVAF